MSAYEDFGARVRAVLAETPIDTVDPRWRPMRTAPRDGTVVEVVEHGHWDRFARAVWRPEPDGWSMLGPLSGNPYKVAANTILAWRPAHPEWNEEGD